jgi:hypothetical protein
MLSALLAGFRRVLAAPAVLFSVYVITLAAAVPFALLLWNSLQTHLGASLMADSAASGVNWDWWQEFAGQARGLETTFTPSVIGFATPLDNLSMLLDGSSRPPAIIAAVAAYGALWLFLWGGILDRYARARATRSHGFFGACGVFCFRFLRLGLIAGIFYWALFGPAHDWLLTTAYARFTRNVTSERVVFLWRLGLYAVFGAGLIVVNLVIDYAKIRAVVEDRRSMIGALLAGSRFVIRHPIETLSLYLLNGLLFLALLALYAVIAPGVGGGGLDVWRAFVIGQVYLAARLLLRLTLAASQISLFQSSLAHAAYTAASPRVWPESPAVEAIRNAARSGQSASAVGGR